MARISTDGDLVAVLDRIEALSNSLPGTYEHDELLSLVDALHQFLSAWWRVVYGNPGQETPLTKLPERELTY